MLLVAILCCVVLLVATAALWLRGQVLFGPQLLDIESHFSPSWPLWISNHYKQYPKLDEVLN